MSHHDKQLVLPEGSGPARLAAGEAFPDLAAALSAAIRAMAGDGEQGWFTPAERLALLAFAAEAQGYELISDPAFALLEARDPRLAGRIRLASLSLPQTQEFDAGASWQLAALLREALGEALSAALSQIAGRRGAEARQAPRLSEALRREVQLIVTYSAALGAALRLSGRNARF